MIIMWASVVTGATVGECLGGWIVGRGLWVKWRMGAMAMWRRGGHIFVMILPRRCRGVLARLLPSCTRAGAAFLRMGGLAPALGLRLGLALACALAQSLPSLRAFSSSFSTVLMGSLSGCSDSGVGVCAGSGAGAWI